MPVWVDGAHSMIPLPDGLARFQKLTFKEHPVGDPTVAILIDDDGREYRLAHNQYAGAQSIDVHGEWLLESDPRALQVIEDFVEKLKMEPEANYSLGSMRPVIVIWEAVLRRNGVL